MLPPGKPQRLLPPATRMFSRPSHRLPTGMEAVLIGTVRQICGIKESGKSIFSGSLTVMVLPLIAVISSSCTVERHFGITFVALALALGISTTLPKAGAPVLGPFQS